MINLAIDIGNTLCKVAVMDGGQVAARYTFEELSTEALRRICETHGAKGAAIISAPPCEQIKAWLAAHMERLVAVTPGTSTPLKNLYQTPLTLGSDRMAAAVGASVLFPGENLMIADFGSALTIDVVTAAGEFAGGNISPGAAMRFRALNSFTRALPLCSLDEDTAPTACNTTQAIVSGVVEGMVYEIEGYIARLTEKYASLRVIFTGGDQKFFAKRFKNPIFATSDLVSIGLDRILEYNAH